MQGIPTKIRKKMRKARKKHRERVAAFLQSLGMTDDEENDSCDEKDDHPDSANDDPPKKSNSKNHDEIANS